MTRRQRLAAPFGRLGLAETTAALDLQVMGFAVPLLAIRALGAGPFQVGLLTGCEYVGFLAFGLQAGAVVDRWSAAIVWRSAAAARAALLACVATLLVLDHLALGSLYVLMVALSVCLVLTEVSAPKVLTEVVPPKFLTRANSRIGALISAAELIGPLLAGVVIVGADFTKAIGLALLCALSCVVAVWRLPRTPPQPVGQHTSTLRQVVEGVRYSLSVPLIRMILVRSSIYNLSNVGTSVLFLVLLARLHFSALQIGIVFALAGGAAIVAALLVERVSDRLGLGRTVVAACTGAGLVSLLLPFASRGPIMVAVVIAYAVASAGIMVSNIVLSSLRQAVCATRFLGRTAATTRFVIWGVIPIGSVLAGALGSAVGPRTAITVAVCGELLSVVPLWASGLSSLHSIDDAIEVRVDDVPLVQPSSGD